MTRPPDLQGLQHELAAAMAELSAFTASVGPPDPEQTRWQGSDSTGSVTATVSSGGRLESVTVAHGWRPGTVSPAALVLEASAHAVCARFGVEPGAEVPVPDPDPDPSPAAAQQAVEGQRHRAEAFAAADPARLAAELERQVGQLDAAADQLAQRLDEGEQTLSLTNRARTLTLTFTEAGMLTGAEADQRWAARQSPVSLTTAIQEVLDTMHEQVEVASSPFADLLDQLAEITQDLGTQPKGPARA